MQPLKWGPTETQHLLKAGLAAVAGLAVTHLPLFVAGHDWGSYSAVVFAASAATVHALTLWLTDNRAPAQQGSPGRGR